MAYKGISRKDEIRSTRRKKDTRLFGQKFSETFNYPDGIMLALMFFALATLVTVKIPFAGELLVLIFLLFRKKFINFKYRAFDFPFRVPMLAKVHDGSSPKGKSLGKGITYLGNDLETKEQLYAGDSDLRTHLLILGTTGSGKTELLLGLCANALVQNTGFIYVDGKGDPKLMKDIFRMSRMLGREDDLLLINFITSGRDFIEKQQDKVTNNMNLMSNASSGMLIELLVGLMDDSGGGGDMWKGRAIAFVSALTRPLCYLRDKGFINLDPEKYLEYFELPILEELVFEHNGKYGEIFDEVLAPLRAYLVNIPGYSITKKKKQETKTLEQHGYITMQLTRIFNDLTFNYGHIFKTRVGDVDFYDVVINRRILLVLLPALERAPDSLRMLGKLIVGNIKQMMAGCLGNRVEGQVREIIDSRPTNATNPFYCILDEYGYYAVIGFAVAPAQARSLGFSVVFAAQDFSSLKKSSAEEADATWENTNIRAVGRITSGQKSETWERIHGAASEGDVGMLTGFERGMGAVSETFRQQDNISIERRSRIDYDDLARQENGEFTFLIGKKERRGIDGGVRVIRGMGFYTASEPTREIRLNDLIPVEIPEPSDLPQNREAALKLLTSLENNTFKNFTEQAIKGEKVLLILSKALDKNYSTELEPEKTKSNLSKMDACLAALFWYLDEHDKPRQANEISVIENMDEKVLAQEVNDIFSYAESRMAELDAQEELEQYEEPEELDESVVVADPDEILEIPSKPEIQVDIEQTCNLLQDAHLSKKEVLSYANIFSKFTFFKTNEDSDEEDEYVTKSDVADTATLMAIEMCSRGKPFTSSADRYAVEESITATKAKIVEQTKYIDPPTPDLVSLDQAQSKLESLSDKCLRMAKEKIKKQE